MADEAIWCHEHIHWCFYQLCLFGFDGIGMVQSESIHLVGISFLL
jgi:hypothetical protein